MFCAHCGTQSTSGQNFCHNCGKPTTNSSSQHNDKPQAPDGTIQQKSYKDRIIQVLVALVVIGLIVYGSIDNDSIEMNNTAIANFDTGDSQQAITQLQAASQTAVTNENKINSLKNLAYVYSSDNQDGSALTTFKEAFALASAGSYDYYLILGEIKLLENKPKEALEAYSQAYKKNPNDFQINNALALFYLDIEEFFPEYVDYPKALKYALRAEELTDLQTATENLAIAYYYNENYDKAISLFSTMDYKKHPVLAYWLGLSYAAKEDVVNAKLYFQQAIAGGVKVPPEILEYINS